MRILLERRSGRSSGSTGALVVVSTVPGDLGSLHDKLSPAYTATNRQNPPDIIETLRSSRCCCHARSISSINTRSSGIAQHRRLRQVDDALAVGEQRWVVGITAFPDSESTDRKVTGIRLRGYLVHQPHLRNDVDSYSACRMPVLGAADKSMKQRDSRSRSSISRSWRRSGSAI